MSAHGRLLSSSKPIPALCRRHASTARNEPLTLLHKAINFVPAVFHQTRPTTRVVTESSDFWSQNLSRVYDDLTSTAERPARVVVYAVDQSSGAQDLVNALLDEPFSSDQALSKALQDRWKDNQHRKITLSLSTPDASTSSHIALPSSSYLAHFSVPVDIVEIQSPPNTRHLDDDSVAELFQADVPVLVFNPISTPLSALENTHLPSNTILVITSSPSAIAPDYLAKLFQSHPNWRVVVADPKRAVDAIHILKAHPNSSTAVQRYQDGFAGSGVPSVTAALKSSLTFTTSSTLQSVASLRRKTALAALQDVLSICNTTVERVKDDANALRRRVSHLNDRVEGLKVTAETDILGMKESASVGDSIQEALEKATKDMKILMDRLTWWKVLWRIDDIGTTVSSGVQQVWCTELEKKLILKTGELSAVQRELSESSFSLLSSSSSPYNSAVLRNKLLQFQTSPSHSLTPRSLTHPLHSRRSQIMEYPTTRLHLAGQRIVMAMSSGVAAGAGVGWSGWLGWFTGTGEGLFGLVGMEPTTAVGVGMFGAIASMRWAVGRWESAKKKWWADWKRVGQGLDRDLRTNVQLVVSEKVVVVADTVCKELSEATRAQKEEMAVIQDKIDKISVELQGIKDS